MTYGGEVALTYFFSTSGGQTENVENVFRGSDPKPWLRGVRDPYDALSPYHRWGPYTWSRKAVQRKLGRLVSGRFRGIDVLQRGVSPRVVRARVRGSRGSRIVSGSQLRAALGLRDNWFYVRRVTTRKSQVVRTSSLDRGLASVSGRGRGVRRRSVALQPLSGQVGHRPGRSASRLSAARPPTGPRSASEASTASSPAGRRGRLRG